MIWRKAVLSTVLYTAAITTFASSAGATGVSYSDFIDGVAYHNLQNVGKLYFQKGNDRLDTSWTIANLQLDANPYDSPNSIAGSFLIQSFRDGGTTNYLRLEDLVFERVEESLYVLNGTAFGQTRIVPNTNNPADGIPEDVRTLENPEQQDIAFFLNLNRDAHLLTATGWWTFINQAVGLADFRTLFPGLGNYSGDFSVIFNAPAPSIPDGGGPGSPVPEPASIVLLGAGSAGFAMRRCRRRCRQ